MTDLSRLFAAALVASLATGALAQETAPATAAEPETTLTGDAAVPDGLSMGTEIADENAVGTTYTAATHGDWEQRCVRSAEGTDPCQLYQLLKDADGNAVAEISLFGLPSGQQAVAGATIIAPLETLLTENLALKVDAAAAKVYPFTWCSQIGCVARVGFTQGEVDAFKRGIKATVTIVPVVAPEQKVNLDVSLKGFTSGFDAVNAANGN